MKATSGSLRLDQAYAIEGQDYHGKFSDNMSAETCENCGAIITNIAIVRGSIDNRTYRIGLDCAATLSGIQPSAIAQAKKVLANKAKCLKFIKTECKLAILSESGERAALYDYEPMQWAANRKYDVSMEAYGDVLKNAGVPIKSKDQLFTERMTWISQNAKTAERHNDGKYITVYNEGKKVRLFENVCPELLTAIDASGATMRDVNY